MQFANEHEIEDWLRRWGHHPILGPAARTLCSLKDAVNGCSDGWAYWQAPRKSAQKLIALLSDADSAYRRCEETAVTVADLDQAYRPIKAFHTRHGARYGFDVQLHHPAAPAGKPPLTLFA